MIIAGDIAKLSAFLALLDFAISRKANGLKKHTSEEIINSYQDDYRFKDISKLIDKGVIDGKKAEEIAFFLNSAYVNFFEYLEKGYPSDTPAERRLNFLSNPLFFPIAKVINNGIDTDKRILILFLSLIRF